MERIEYLEETLERLRKEELGAAFELGFLKYHKEFVTYYEWVTKNRKNKNINIKKRELGDYIKKFRQYSKELTVNGLEAFFESKMKEYDEERKEISQLIEILKDKKISEEIVDEKIEVYSEYGFYMKKEENFLLIQRYPGQSLEMGFSYKDENFKIPIIPQSKFLASQ